MSSARVTSCPGCGKTLYRSPRIQWNPHGWIPLSGGPVIECFEHGSFVLCPSCFQRVPVVPARSPFGLGFRLSYQVLAGVSRRASAAACRPPVARCRGWT
jgi:hypothetical protein